MGDMNQFRWIQHNKSLIRGPVLEIGSRHYTKDVSINYRQLCSGLDFIGIDMSAGDNVDMVLDFTQEYEEIQNTLGSRQFKTVICCSVLEHVDNVFKMAQNISKITEANSVLFVSVPFIWRFHGYPSDYWRFTPEGIKYLFPDFVFQENLGLVSSNVDKDAELLRTNPNDFAVRPLNSVSKMLLKVSDLVKSIGKNTQKGLDSYSYLLLPTNINMIGIKKVA